MVPLYHCLDLVRVFHVFKWNLLSGELRRWKLNLTMALGEGFREIRGPEKVTREEQLSKERQGEQNR